MRFFMVHFCCFALTLPQNRRDMRRFLTFLCAIGLLASCSTARQGSVGADLNPNEVFTVTDADIASETLLINNLIKGEWNYSGPAVDVSGKNLLAGVGKPIAKGKLKGKLKKAFKKVGLDKASPQFTFNNDGTCIMRLMGVNFKGDYHYNPDLNQISFKWHGVPLNATLKRDGKKKLRLTFEADKLLRLLTLASKFSDSSAIKAIGKLLDNYEDIMVGFELKK